MSKFKLEKSVLLALAIGLTVLVVLIAIIIKLPYTSDYYTRDVTSTFGAFFLAGILSNLGIILWAIAGSICGFTLLVLHRTSNKCRQLKLFLFSASMLSFYLMSDDLLTIHELISYVFGINDVVILAIIAAYTAFHFVYFRDIVLKSNLILLIGSLVFLATSILVDIRFPDVKAGSAEHWIYLLEDGFKWLGIVFWLFYHADTSIDILINTKKYQTANDGNDNKTIVAPETPIYPEIGMVRRHSHQEKSAVMLICFIGIYNLIHQMIMH